MKTINSAQCNLIIVQKVLIPYSETQPRRFYLFKKMHKYSKTIKILIKKQLLKCEGAKGFIVKVNKIFNTTFDYFRPSMTLDTRI